MGSPAGMGVARLVRAFQVAPRTSTVPFGPISSTAIPVSPMIHSRPMVGVANRVRIMAGIPPAIPTMVTRTPATRLSHDRGVPSKRNSDPTTRAAVPMAVQARGTPVWTSTA